jgi:3-hydroxybutyryl-CoA dehydrogenase
VLLSGDGWGSGLETLIQEAGYSLTDETSRRLLISVAASGRNEGLESDLKRLDRYLPSNTPILCQCADITLAEASSWVSSPERLAGFDGLFFNNGPVATLVAGPDMTPQTRLAIEDFVTGLGRLPIWVQDSPGLVLPRIVSMLANEAAFAVQEGVAEAGTIDLAMRLGVNYPVGPLSWAKALGYSRVLAVLDHLHGEYHEDRYRAAPLLRRWVRLRSDE